ncbi:MAG: putative nucleotidyltransferase substrate binding domain-containing protein [Solirubrobacterales bacterium]
MHDVAEFLGAHHPFSGLDQEALERLAERVEVEFFAAGTTIVPQGERQGSVRVVRRGEVELLDQGRVLDLLTEGELFGHPSMLSGLPTGFEARAAEDTLCYAIVAEDALPVLSRPEGMRFLGRSILDRPRPIAAELTDLRARELPPGVATKRATELIRRQPVICRPDTTVREAARLMGAEAASSVLVQGDDGELGIVTDSDFRLRVVAGGLTADSPVAEAMSSPVITVEPDQSGAEVMLAMLDNDIRHVPVVSARAEILGVIAGIDLVAAETQTPFMLRRAITEAESAGDLRRAAGQLNPTVVALHGAELGQAQISAIISVVADALVRRMIEISVESAGPPPVEFAWLSLGSHGRREAVPSSDIDSGMAWADQPEPASAPRRSIASEAVTGYMHAIAEEVAGLQRSIGWRLDPHGVTASGAFSASSIGEWRRAIRAWLSRPSDERVLIATSILLDGRTVYGPEQSLDVKALLFETGDRATLLRWMLRLALASKPPTGFLRDIVVEGSGEHRGTFDIKRGGLLPIVDLARYGALRAGIRVTPTVERLQAAADEGVLDRTEAGILEEAYDLFASMRLEHQVRQLEAGAEPDNHIDPKQLNPLTRRYLRDAFREVAAVQRSLVAELDRDRGRS